MRSQWRIALYMGLRSDYEHGIAQGVIRFAKEHGRWKLFGHGWTLDEVRNFREWRGDGIIAIVHNRQEADLLVRTGLPVVDVAGAVEHPRLFPVTNDDVQAGRFGGDHLRHCGLHAFGFVGVTGAHWSESRRLGFLAALDQSGSAVPCFHRPLPWWEKPGTSRDLKAFLKALPLPVGMMAANDTAGVKVSRACGELDLDVPDQVAIIGVDNEDILCELSDPSLSSIPCDCPAIGRQAAEILHRMLEGEPMPRPPLRVPPRSPVIRASSNMIAIEDPFVHAAVQAIRNSSDLGLRVSDVVRQVPLGRRALEIRFRRVRGCSIREEIERTKLDRARHLLKETDQPVKRIAVGCGFGSHQRFHAVFALAVGCTPQQYRLAALV